MPCSEKIKIEKKNAVLLIRGTCSHYAASAVEAGRFAWILCADPWRSTIPWRHDSELPDCVLQTREWWPS